MNENYRSIPIHPEWAPDIMMYIATNNRRPLTDYPLFQEGRMMAKMLTYAEYEQSSGKKRMFFDAVYPDIKNDPLKIIGIDTDKWWSIYVTFADNDSGIMTQKMEDSGVFDLEKHFYAVPRFRPGVWVLNSLSKEHILRIMTFDLVARENMFRGPDRWFPLRHPVSLQANRDYQIRSIPILSDLIGCVQDYDFHNDEWTKELLYTGRMGMELYPLDGKPDTELSTTRYQCIDPKNIVATLLEIDKTENMVIVRMKWDTCDRLSRMCKPEQSLYARPRGFVKEGPFGKTLEKFITFDIVIR